MSFLNPRALISLLVIITVVVFILVAFSFMRVVRQEQEATVKVNHFRIKAAGLWIVGFTIKSSIGGFYRYSIFHNSSMGVINSSHTGYIEPPNSFAYAVNIEPEPNVTIVVNIKVWWGERLIDEVNHYIRAED